VVVGSFQQRRFYAPMRARWRALARGAAVSLVFADFPRLSAPAGAPVEVPLGPGEPLREEWAIIVLSATVAVCLVARERPGESERADAERRFDAVLSLDPATARGALAHSVDLARAAAPLVAGRLEAELEAVPRIRTAPDRAAPLALLTRTLLLLDRNGARHR
jgi:DICT domain-containing protein